MLHRDIAGLVKVLVPQVLLVNTQFKFDRVHSVGARVPMHVH